MSVKLSREAKRYLADLERAEGGSWVKMDGQFVRVVSSDGIPLTRSETVEQHLLDSEQRAELLEDARNALADLADQANSWTSAELLAKAAHRRALDEASARQQRVDEIERAFRWTRSFRIPDELSGDMRDDVLEEIAKHLPGQWVVRLWLLRTFAFLAWVAIKWAWDKYVTRKRRFK
jgi:hypothetical protein